VVAVERSILRQLRNKNKIAEHCTVSEVPREVRFGVSSQKDGHRPLATTKSGTVDAVYDRIAQFS
jgi:hypothetical protein